MGLLEQQLASGLLNQPATANPNMLAQALKARNQPRKQLNGQGLLDTAAIGLSPVPVIGDVLGLAADANRFVNEPESRTPLNFGLAALGAIPFIPPLVSMGLGKFAQSQGKTIANLPTGPARNQAGAIVYHGSPHKFDQFDSSKIGTGEGAQAYGHGLYFAESPTVAKTYQGKVSAMQGGTPTVDGKPINWDDPKQAAAFELARHNGDRAAAANFYEQTFKNSDVPKVLRSNEPLPNIDMPGSLYKVDLPDEAIAKMLDWDKPLSQQAPEVRRALNKMPLAEYADDVWTGQEFIRFLERQKSSAPNLDVLREPVAASKEMNKFGIPGVRYLDGGSRGAGNGTSNYVVFPGNEGLLKILERQ